jgi:hypothetical protein
LERLKVRLHSLLGQVERYLPGPGEEPDNHGFPWDLPFEDDLRPALECLRHLGWGQDALLLAEGQRRAMERASRYPGFDAALAVSAAKRLATHLREILQTVNGVEVPPAFTAPPANKTRRSRMTVKAANEKAKDLAKRMKRRFFLLPETAQAKLIGCHLRTWQQTELYQKAENLRLRFAKQIAEGKAPGSPTVTSLTPELAAQVGEGGRDEVANQAADRELERLRAEQEADDRSSSRQKMFYPTRRL